MDHELTINKELLEIVTPTQAWHYSIIPLEKNGHTLTLLTCKGTDENRQELELLLGKTIRFEMIDSVQLKKHLLQCYPQAEKEKAQDLTVQNDFEDFLPKIIEEARLLKSSDIHVEIYDNECRIRFRIDGKLVERYQVSKDRYPALINKVKIQAHLDISEKRLPQDGRILFRNGTDKIDIRVSILPTLYGEKVVLRLLNKEMTNIALSELGFSAGQYSQYQEAISKPNGIILISGPTGSGKTTTLYATLKELNHENVNILTIEDPVEYTIEGVNQVQVKENIGYTFAAALRTFLRQDPDIIMLGEIRDEESAQMAIRAALTGHLVFSTIHTNSAWGTITRLLDMDIPPYLVANTLNLSMAQRLVRLLCPHCKTEVPFNPEEFQHHDLIPDSLKTHFVAKGCDHCFYTGYSGRKAIYEIIPLSPDISENIRSGHLNIAGINKKHNLRLLKEAAIDLFVSGQTSYDEIYSYLI